MSQIFDIRTRQEIHPAPEDFGPPPGPTPFVAPDLQLLGDCVGVVHLGQVHVYETPQDLHAAVLVACAPQLKAAEAAAAARAVAAYRAGLMRGITAALCGLSAAAMIIVVWR